MGKTIRIPRTTAVFVTGLGRILREEFGFKIVEHEHWTFKHVGEWTECGSPGECPVHGISDKSFELALREAEKHDPTPCEVNWHIYHRAENSFVPCYAFRRNAYIGAGQARRAGLGNPVGLPKLDLRVRIQQDYWEIGSTLHQIQIWIREEDGNIQKGEFGLLEDGRPYRTVKELPDGPPRKIAFWRSADEVLA